MQTSDLNRTELVYFSSAFKQKISFNWEFHTNLGVKIQYFEFDFQIYSSDNINIPLQWYI